MLRGGMLKKTGDMAKKPDFWEIPFETITTFSGVLYCQMLLPSGLHLRKRTNSPLIMPHSVNCQR